MDVVHIDERSLRIFLNTIRAIWESRYEMWCEVVGEVCDEYGYYEFLTRYTQLWDEEVMNMPKCKGKKGKK